MSIEKVDCTGLFAIADTNVLAGQGILYSSTAPLHCVPFHCNVDAQMGRSSPIPMSLQEFHSSPFRCSVEQMPSQDLNRLDRGYQCSRWPLILYSSTEPPGGTSTEFRSVAMSNRCDRRFSSPIHGYSTPPQLPVAAPPLHQSRSAPMSTHRCGRW